MTRLSERKCVDLHQNPKIIENKSFDENLDVPIECDIKT